MISGALAATAALILTGKPAAAEPTTGTLWELDAIAAAAIGGASLMGGGGSIVGTIMGAIILGGLRTPDYTASAARVRTKMPCRGGTFGSQAC